MSIRKIPYHMKRIGAAALAGLASTGCYMPITLEAKVDPDAIHVEEGAVTVEQGAITVEQGAVSIEDLMGFRKLAEEAGINSNLVEQFIDYISMAQEYYSPRE